MKPFFIDAVRHRFLLLPGIELSVITDFCIAKESASPPAGAVLAAPSVVLGGSLSSINVTFDNLPD
jgi:hypothetical protein